MTLELPEGPRILKDEKTGERYTATEIEGLFSLEPYVERLPLFTDLAGNQIHNGDTVFYYCNRMGKIESIITNGYATVNVNPSFKHHSDCERWVASNVKQYTLEEAYGFAKKIVCDFGSQFKTKEELFAFIDSIVQEKCLPKSPDKKL